MMTQSELFLQSPVPWTPHAYSKKAVKFLLEHACAALFLDPGLGKTSITLAAIKMLIARKLVGKVLIVAPLRVCYSVWPREVDKWEDFNHLRIEVLHGADKEEALNRDADIYVINPEGLDWLLQTKKTKVISPKTGKVTTKIEVDLRRFRKFGFDTLVIDELTKFKHTTSGRFKALKLVHKTFGRRWGLTGSPASNGLLVRTSPTTRPSTSTQSTRTASSGCHARALRTRFTSACRHSPCAWRPRTTWTCHS
jgi:superfamily II DNA or RNA helicase